MAEAVDTEPVDKLTALLAEGWTIAGYSTDMMALGAMAHHVLLRKDSGLLTVTVVLMGEKETGRTFNTLAPAPPARKGWF